jgi:UDP-N-acetylglucosamine 2-epimerase (non-hydrolysing)
MKLLTIIGTRPEAVKMAPVLAKLARRREITSLVCATGQHRQLFDDAAFCSGVTPDFGLRLMEPDQQPAELQARALPAIERLLAAERPDRVVVHGDTGSGVAGARAAHALGIPVSHVEAGLRTHRLDNPWPEEGYRREIDSLADQLFAPTPLAARHLMEEQVEGRIFVTGNSGVDALHAVLNAMEDDAVLRRNSDATIPPLPKAKPVVLVTLHRRESIGAPLRRMCGGLRRLAADGMHLVVTLHPNPSVTQQLEEELGGRDGIQLVQPFSHPTMVRMMQRASLIITDSGGVQEEAPSLGTPVLVAREVTERPEGVALGLAHMIGCCPELMMAQARAALARPIGAAISNPYGDGAAAERIVAGLLGEPFAPFGAPETTGASAPILLVG